MLFDKSENALTVSVHKAECYTGNNSARGFFDE